MSRNTPIPFFPTPPEEYTPSYFSEISRSFTVYVNQIHNPGLGRNTTTFFTDIQSGNDQGLEVGSLFEIGGIVHIAVADILYLKGVAATGAVGSVTVVTT